MTHPFRDFFEKIRGVILLFSKFPIEKKKVFLGKGPNFFPHISLYALISQKISEANWFKTLI